MADENEFLFIVDEVQTGLGLTGKMWAYEHMDVLPDVLSFGKRTQVCGTRSVRFRPSLTIKREDVDEGLEITRRALGSIQP